MGAGSAGNSERAEMQSVPNHGVASGAGSTASTLGPRQEGGKGCDGLAASPLHLHQPSPANSLFPFDLNTSPILKLGLLWEKRLQRKRILCATLRESDLLDLDVRCLLVHLTGRSKVKPTFPILPSWPMGLTFSSLSFWSQLWTRKQCGLINSLPCSLIYQVLQCLIYVDVHVHTHASRSARQGLHVSQLCFLLAD